MQYRGQFPTFENDVLEDDIDILFQQLEPVEPPPSFVSHILQHVSAYAAANTTGTQTLLSNSAMPLLLDELDHWLGQQRKRSLC